MATGLTFTPIDGAQIDLGIYSSGVESDIAGRWGRHVIPGQRGSIKEDLGEGDLKSVVTLQFVGRRKADYETVMASLIKRRRGTLQHPRRGARDSIIERFRERIRWTEMGEATLVDVFFEDAVIGQADVFKGGHSAFAQKTVAQSRVVDQTAATLKLAVFNRPSLQTRANMLVAEARTTAATEAARAYAAAAEEAVTFGLYDPATQAQLKALPPLAQAATLSLRAVGPAADTQETILGLEVMLFAAAQLDAAIRAAQPIPIETEVSRAPGQSVYAFVQQRYGRSGKSPAAMRGLVSLILRLNPQIRRPLLIPQGTIVVRPAS